ncbi:NUDIX domain-containing protein [Nocardia sp. NPDC004722]
MDEYVPCVQTLLVRDGQVLLMRRQNTGVGDDWWAAPGGCIEAGEDFASAAARETAEEIGVDVQLTDANLATIVRLDASHEGGARAVYTYLATTWAGEPSIKESDLCSGLGWFPLADLPLKTMESTRIALQSVDGE